MAAFCCEAFCQVAFFLDPWNKQTFSPVSFTSNGHVICRNKYSTVEPTVILTAVTLQIAWYYFAPLARGYLAIRRMPILPNTNSPNSISPSVISLNVNSPTR